MIQGPIPGLDGFGPTDEGLESVRTALLAADPDGRRSAQVFRYTYDQLYDGQRTGRYRWDQLYKTEKTHYGTLIEINLRREFDGVIGDGLQLDFLVSGHEIDCKYAHSRGAWMLPPESFGELLLVCTASDQDAVWSMGVVRAATEYRRTTFNRDGKTGLNELGRNAVQWLHDRAPLPPNVLLSLSSDIIDRIFAPRSGQKRVDELFRSVQRRRIHRNTVATVAQQDDYMKRVRANGGSRTNLAREGILIMGGDYRSHREIATSLGLPTPLPGELVSAAVMPCDELEQYSVEISGRTWRLAALGEALFDPAPALPRIQARHDAFVKPFIIEGEPS
jgi:hypothetical protein